MDYLVGDNRYSFNYQELKSDYVEYSLMSDTDFLKRLPQILHFACMVAYLKNLQSEATVGDEGIIHQLVHVLTGTANHSLSEIRQQFSSICELV
jgi:hypothetical protein